MKLKYISFIKVISFILIIALINNIYCDAAIIPVTIEITTEGDYIDKVIYQDYEIEAKRIVSKESGSIGYCLEIDKDYPSGESFNLTSDMQDEVLGILKAGYPDYSGQELGLLNDDEAYFATQIALWAYIEGYNVNEFKGTERIINAIKKIYDGSNNTRTLSAYDIKTYNTSPEVQDIIMLLKKDASLNQRMGSMENQTGITTENNDQIIIGK